MQISCNHNIQSLSNISNRWRNIVKRTEHLIRRLKKIFCTIVSWKRAFNQNVQTIPSHLQNYRYLTDFCRAYNCITFSQSMCINYCIVKRIGEWNNKQFKCLLVFSWLHTPVYRVFMSKLNVSIEEGNQLADLPFIGHRANGMGGGRSLVFS